MRGVARAGLLLISVVLPLACGGSQRAGGAPALIDGSPDFSPSQSDVAVLDASDATTVDAPSVVRLRVLFIGNSYVYVNDLPEKLRRIAETAGVPPVIETEQVVVGGATLQSHWDTGDAQKKIDDKTWTHVVLQGQSLEPLFQPAIFDKYALSFGERIETALARPTFFATWARAEGDASFASSWSGGTPSAMQDKLTAAYRDVAAKHASAVVVAVGESFRLSLKERPLLALHSEDKSHPTVAGTYLAACTFYVALTGKKVPAASAAPPEIAATDVAFLRSIADRGAP